MATMQQLEDSLRAADRAGNVEDARALASEIRRRRSSSGAMQFGDALKYAGQGFNKGLFADILGGTVDLVNRAPQIVNLLPGEQGVGPISERPVGGSEWFNDQLSGLGMGYGDIENVPEKYRPIARGGEVVGQSVPFAAAPLARGAQLGTRAAQTSYTAPGGARAASGGGVFSPVVESARTSPALFAAGEASAATGAGFGAGVAEKLLPGDEGAALAGEVLGGFANPAALVLAGARRASQTVNRAVSSVTPEGRKRAAAGVVQGVARGMGEDPSSLVRSLQHRETDVPSMTAGMQADSPALLAIERTLMRDSSQYGADVQEQLRSAVEEANASVQRAVQSGDPYAAQEAFRARLEYFDGLIKARVAQAQQAASEAAGKVIPANPRTRAEGNLAAREILESAIEDARATERELWGQINRSAPIETPNLREALEDATAGLLPGEALNAPGPVRAAIDRAVRPVGSDDPGFNLVLDVLRGKRAAPRRPRSLTDYLVDVGGLREDAGELAGMGINPRARPGLLNNRGGMQLDDAAQAAWEAGYFPDLPERPSIREFLDVLSNDFNKRSLRYDPAQENEARFFDLLSATDEAVNQRGLDLGSMSNAEARSALQGLPELSMATSGDLLTLRSRLLTEARRMRGGQSPDHDGARRLSILADAILADLGQLPGTEDARAFSRALNQNLTQGYPGRALGQSGGGAAAIAPEMTLERGIASGGPQSAVNARQMRDAAQFASGRGAEMSDAQSDMLLDMAQGAVNPNTGEVDPTKLANWRARNRELLAQFPELDRALADAAQAQALANRVASRAREQRKTLERSALAKATGFEDPLAGVRSILRGKTPARDLGQLVNTARRAGEDAVAGLRGAVLETVLADSALPNGLFSERAILDFLDGPQGQVLRNGGILSEGQANNLRVLAGKAGAIERALASGRELDEIMDAPDAVTDLLMRVAGSTLATRGVFSGVTGGGNQLIIAQAGSKAFRRLFDKLPQARIRDVLQEAVRKPRLMADLLSMNPQAPESAPYQRVNAFLLQGGFLEPSEAEPQDGERTGSDVPSNAAAVRPSAAAPANGGMASPPPLGGLPSLPGQHGGSFPILSGSIGRHNGETIGPRFTARSRGALLGHLLREGNTEQQDPAQGALLASLLMEENQPRRRVGL